MRAKKAATKKTTKSIGASEPRCGLCGATKNLTKTECCDQWICDDEANYVMFSYARNSCSRNHQRYTLCSYHFNEGHQGQWQTCEKCRKDFETPFYVEMATNDCNFVKLENPPEFEPVRCHKCKSVINVGTDGFSMGRDGYTCMNCSDFKLPI